MTTPDYVVLVLSDEFRYVVHYEAAAVLLTLRSALAYNFAEQSLKQVVLSEIGGDVLEKVVDYLYYHWEHKERVGETEEFEVPTEMALELLMAADYLDI